ncbi:MAG TPA: tetratricopeptide repeat protein [Saprospiraceae bacterium]|nr:tetratricopeptide repeat protein [Saprospiraceae bacterium]
MEHRTKKNHPPHELVSEYEARNEQGDQMYLAEKDFCQLINYYEDEREVTRALDVVDHAISLHSYCADFLIIKARLLLSTSKPLRALRYLDQAEIISPCELDIYLLRARVLCELGHFDTALAILESARKFSVGTDLVEIALCEAFIFERQKLFDKMFEALAQALRIDPQNEEALERIWWSVENSKKYDESIDFHKELLDQDAYSYLAWFNLAQGYSCNGDYEKAIEAMEYSFLINPDFEMGYLDCADLCIQIGRYDQALKIYQELIENFGGDSEELVKLAECEFYTGRIRDCKRTLIEALKMDSYNDEAYYYLGKCFNALGKYKNAISALIKAIDLEDRREEYYAELASAYQSAGELGKADFYFRKATEIGPELDTYWYMHIRFLIGQGEYEKALDVLEEADYQTSSAGLDCCKAICLFKLKRRSKAINALRDALLDNFSTHEILFELIPELKEDKEITSMLRYYQGEKKIVESENVRD